MPTRKKEPDRRPLSKEERAYRDRLAWDIRFAHSEVFRIEHRDQMSKIVPLVYNAAQEALYSEFEKIRSFNIAKCIKGIWAMDRLGYKALAVKYKIRKSDKKIEDQMTMTLKTLVKTVMAHGPSRALAEARAAGFGEDKVTDSPVSMIIGKPRQEGISTWIEALGAHRAMFCDHVPVLCMAHEEKAAKNVFSMTKKFHDLWPGGPHPEDKMIPDLSIVRPQLAFKTKESIEWANGSRFEVQTVGGKEGARSFRFVFLHFSEFAHYSDYSQAAAAISGAPKHAWIFKESTAKGLGGQFYDDWMSAMTVDAVIAAHEEKDASKLASWNATFKWFWPWHKDEAYTLDVEPWEEKQIRGSLTPKEVALKKRLPKLSCGQLKWRRWKISQMRDSTLTPEAFFEQEFPASEAEMFQGSGNKVFDHGRLARMEEASALMRPKFFRFEMQDIESIVVTESSRSGWNLVVWETPKKSSYYVIGGDVSYGKDRNDRSALTVFDRTDGSVMVEVASFYGYIHAQALGDIMTLLGEWYCDAFLVPEINGPGLATAGRIVIDNRYPHVYHQRSLDTVDGASRETNTFRFGFYKAPGSKAGIIERMRSALYDGQIIIRTPEILRECRLYENKNGKYGAPSREHDDGVDAISMAWQGHIGGQAPPITPRMLEKRAAAGNEDVYESAVWAAIKRKDDRIQDKLKKHLGGEYRSG